MACVTQEASSDLVEHALQQGFGCRSRYPALCPRPFTASSSARASSSRASSSARMPATFSSCFRRAASKAPCALSMACCRRSRSFSRATSSFARSRARRLCSFSKASAAFRSDASSLPRFGAFCAGDRHRHFLLSGCRLAPARATCTHPIRRTPPCPPGALPSARPSTPSHPKNTQLPQNSGYRT